MCLVKFKRLVEGTVVIMDLDKFEEMTISMGWDQYKPNIVTGTLTQLVEWLVRKWSAFVVYGLDPKRGTEEVVLEIPNVRPEELRDDLEYIRREINRLGASITIVAVYGFVGLKACRDRREAYTATPTRRLALKLLRKIKRIGGNRVLIS